MKTSNRQMRGGSSGMHPERRITLDSIRVDVLPPHPLSTKIYGKPKPTPELLKSITDVGLLQPLIVNDFGDGSFQLLVGNTRAEAWRILLKQKKVSTVWVPCRFVKLSHLEAEKLVIDSNRQRVKTKGQKVREAAELFRIHEALAKQRQAAGKALIGPKGKATKTTAAQLGMSHDTVEKSVELVTQADSGSAKAKTALAQLDHNKTSVAAAYRSVAPKNSAMINVGVQEARELAKLFKNAEVMRSRREGLFHVTIRDMTPEQVRKLAKTI